MGSYNDDDKTRIGKGLSADPVDSVSSKPPWMSQGGSAKEAVPANDSPPSWMPNPQEEAAPPQAESSTPSWMPGSTTSQSPAPPPTYAPPPDTSQGLPSSPPVQPAQATWTPPPQQEVAQPSWMQQAQAQPEMAPQTNFIPPPQEGGSDDLLLVVEGAGGGREYPLRPGQRYSVGREANQDIVIGDRTLSRQHLVLQRTNDRITVQIIGLNGLVHNGATLKSQTIDLNVPASFTIGKISCRLKKKLDNDATIMMSAPAASQPVGMGGSSFSSPAPPYQSTPPSPGGGAYQSPPPSGFSQPVSQPQPVAPSFSPESPSSGYDNFDSPDFGDDTFAGDDPFQPVAAPTGGDKKKYLIIGGVVLGVLLIIGVCVFLFRGSSDDEVKEVVRQPATSAVPPPIAAEPNAAVVSSQSNDLHGKYYAEAYRLFSEGDAAMACDYLKDISASSAYRERAEALALKIGDCSI